MKLNGKYFGVGMMVGGVIQAPLLASALPQALGPLCLQIGYVILGYLLYVGAHRLLVKPYLL